MARLIVGVIIASVVLYGFGYFYWGMGPPYRTEIWKQAVDDETAGAALAEQFPERGVYFVPGFDHDAETLEGLHAEGPVAFVYMLDVDGRPMVDPTIMIGGFVLNVLALLLIGLLLKIVAPALATYGARVGFVALAGLAAAILIDGGGAVWWQIPWQWKLYQGVYDLAFWIIAGVILAAFIRPEPHLIAADKTVVA